MKIPRHYSPSSSYSYIIRRILDSVLRVRPLSYVWFCVSKIIPVNLLRLTVVCFGKIAGFLNGRVFFVFVATMIRHIGRTGRFMTVGVFKWLIKNIKTLKLVIFICGILSRGVEYVCNKFGSHKKVQEQLQDTLSKQNEQLRKLEETRRNQQLMLEDYSERLSAEMGKKISANESSVENVGIRNRPMNVADEFDQLCSNEWFSAKEVCDEKCEDAAESEKIKILYNIMMLAEHQTNSIFEELYKKTNVMLTYPFGSFEPGNSIKTIGNSYSKYAQQTGEGTDIAIEIEQDPAKVNGCTEESPKLPLELTNSMGDYLRKQADVVDLTCVEKAFSARLEFLSSKINPDIWECVKDDTAIRTYILSTLRLAWKMAIQRPKMEFKGSDQWLGDRFQDLYWSSVNPEEMKMPSFTVNPVYPMLYHGKQFMKKGKVLILKT